MNKIDFNKIKIQNFLSIGEEPIEIEFKKQLNLITGYNKNIPELKNGIGKSSIISALMFALFDDPMKKITKKELVNDKIKKNCSVELEFTVTSEGTPTKYKIIRQLAPSKCSFYVNVEDKTQSSIPLTNEYIDKCLKINKTLFKHSIVMSIGVSESFFSMNKQRKREFIEGVFDLNIFSKMLDDVRKESNESKKTKEEFSYKLDTEANNIKKYKESEDSFEDTKQKNIRNLNDRILDIKKTIEQLQDEIKDIPDYGTLKDEKDAIQEKSRQLSNADTKLSNEVFNIKRDRDDINKDINNLENVPDYCTECNRKLDGQLLIARKDKIEQLKGSLIEKTERLVKLEEGTDKLTKMRDETNEKLSSVMEKISNIESIKSLNRSIESNIARNTTLMSSIEADLLQTKNQKSTFTDAIKESAEKYKEYKKNKSKAEYELNILDACKFILSEEGVKSSIIKQLKDFLNHKLNEYLEYLYAPVYCKFDEYFEETLVDQNGNIKSYEALSSGEQKRIDLAVLFALQDMLKIRSGNDITLTFYDEILDTSICEMGRQKVLELLKERSKDNAIYIISHRSKMSELIDNEIVLVKENDFTKLERTE